jgi:acyl carrier protein
VNDGAALHQYLSEDLSASTISARLTSVAGDIYDRCASGHRQNDDADARRWAYALIGQIATEAILLAATPPASAAHRARAEHRFDASIAVALGQATRGPGVNAAELQSMIGSYAGAIGDVEQSLAGEDHELDAMLRRGPRDERSIAPAAVHRPEPRRVERPAPVVPAAAVTTGVPATAAALTPEPTTPAAAPAADAAAVERFIVKRVAAALKMREASIDPNRSLFDYGIDSVTAVMLTASLEEWLGIDCNPELVYDMPVIRRFAAHVAERQAASKCV